MYRHGKHGKRSVFCFFFSIDLSVRNLFFPQAAEAAASVVNASHFFGTTNSCDVHRNHFVWLQKFFTLVHWLHSFSSKQKYSSSKINLNLKYLNVFFMCQIYVFRCVLPSFFRPEAREDARRESTSSCFSSEMMTLLLSVVVLFRDGIHFRTSCLLFPFPLRLTCPEQFFSPPFVTLWSRRRRRRNRARKRRRGGFANCADPTSERMIPKYSTMSYIIHNGRGGSQDNTLKS